MRPKIGITCRYQIRTTPGGMRVPDVSLDARFGDLILAAGGLPLLIPHAEHAQPLEELFDLLDGVIISGGPDLSPGRYGKEPHPETACMHPRREGTDFRVIELAERRRLPLLAVCLGVQEWNVSRGGTLHQHVPDLDLNPRVAHRNGTEFAFHPVRLERGSLIHAILGAEVLPVYSSHHQCIDQLGTDLVATAWAEDGIIEAVQDPRRPFALGLQWHPEDMPNDPLQRRIFESLVSAAKRDQGRMA